jgi:predicted anti-sigma-YlaC factor YlaD
MHGSVRDGLENLLAAKPSAAGSHGLGLSRKHLAACEECAKEVSEMSAQAELLRSWRSPREVEPAAGFYARVLQRIEERTKDSIWAVFIYSPFGKRLAFASFTLALLLGSYVIGQEIRDGDLLRQSVVAQGMNHYDALVAGDQTQQRDAVLELFAAHEGKVQ